MQDCIVYISLYLYSKNGMAVFEENIPWKLETWYLNLRKLLKLIKILQTILGMIYSSNSWLCRKCNQERGNSNNKPNLHFSWMSKGCEWIFILNRFNIRGYQDCCYLRYNNENMPYESYNSWCLIVWITSTNQQISIAITKTEGCRAFELGMVFLRYLNEFGYMNWHSSCCWWIKDYEAFSLMKFMKELWWNGILNEL